MNENISCPAVASMSRSMFGKGKYMGQDAIEVAGEISTLRLDPKLVPKVSLRFKG